MVTELIYDLMPSPESRFADAEEEQRIETLSLGEPALTVSKASVELSGKKVTMSTLNDPPLGVKSFIPKYTLGSAEVNNVHLYEEAVISLLFFKEEK